MVALKRDCWYVVKYACPNSVLVFQAPASHTGRSLGLFQDMTMLARRTATPADQSRLWEIRTAAIRVTCAAHYPADVIDIWCATPPPPSLSALIDGGSVVVAEEDGHVLGYAAFDTATGEIDAVFVEPVHQGRGIARSLLSALEAMAVEHGIVRLFLSSSLNAAAFYVRAGFSVLGEEIYAHRSGIGIPGVSMEKILGQPR